MKNTGFAISLTFALSTFACASTKKVAEQEPKDPDPAYFLARAAAIDEMEKNFDRVHFEFDSTSITAESRDALSANVEIMRRFRDLGIEVEGHCDETGSTEYNLALGERRAEAIRRYMVTSGIASFRVKTISYGEEMPLVEGDESANGENRRAEFVITIDPTAQVEERFEDTLAVNDVAVELDFE